MADAGADLSDRADVEALLHRRLTGLDAPELLATVAS